MSPPLRVTNLVGFARGGSGGVFVPDHYSIQFDGGPIWNKGGGLSSPNQYMHSGNVITGHSGWANKADFVSYKGKMIPNNYVTQSYEKGPQFELYDQRQPGFPNYGVVSGRNFPSSYRVTNRIGVASPGGLGEAQGPPVATGRHYAEEQYGANAVSFAKLYDKVSDVVIVGDCPEGIRAIEKANVTNAAVGTTHSHIFQNDGFHGKNQRKVEAEPGDFGGEGPLTTAIWYKYEGPIANIEFGTAWTPTTPGGSSELGNCTPIFTIKPGVYAQQGQQGSMGQNAPMEIDVSQQNMGEEVQIPLFRHGLGGFTGNFNPGGNPVDGTGGGNPELSNTAIVNAPGFFRGRNAMSISAKYINWAGEGTMMSALVPIVCNMTSMSGATSIESGGHVPGFFNTLGWLAPHDPAGGFRSHPGDGETLAADKGSRFRLGTNIDEMELVRTNTVDGKVYVGQLQTGIAPSGNSVLGWNSGNTKRGQRRLSGVPTIGYDVTNKSNNTVIETELRDWIPSGCNRADSFVVWRTKQNNVFDNKWHHLTFTEYLGVTNTELSNPIETGLPMGWADPATHPDGITALLSFGSFVPPLKPIPGIGTGNCSMISQYGRSLSSDQRVDAKMMNTGAAISDPEISSHWNGLPGQGPYGMAPGDPINHLAGNFQGQDMRYLDMGSKDHNQHPRMTTGPRAVGFEPKYAWSDGLFPARRRASFWADRAGTSTWSPWHANTAPSNSFYTGAQTDPKLGWAYFDGVEMEKVAEWYWLSRDPLFLDADWPVSIRDRAASHSPYAGDPTFSGLILDKGLKGTALLPGSYGFEAPFGDDPRINFGRTFAIGTEAAHPRSYLQSPVEQNARFPDYHRPQVGAMNSVFEADPHLQIQTEGVPRGSAAQDGSAIWTPCEQSQYFQGKIHSIALWNDCLSNNEVMAIYNKGNGAEFDLAADRGKYTSSDRLSHWWRLGLEKKVENFGLDYAPAPDPSVYQDLNLITDGAGFANGYPHPLDGPVEYYSTWQPINIGNNYNLITESSRFEDFPGI